MNLPVRNASISIAICVALLVLSAIIFVSSFKAASNKPHPDSLQIPSAFQEPPVAPTPTPPPSSLVLTQSTSQAVIIGDSIAPCTIPGQFGGRVHSDNSYWRKFDLEKLTGGAQFNVSSVSFGVEFVNNTQPVTIRLYRNTSGTFPEGVRGPIATTTIMVDPAQSGTVVTTPWQVTIPAQTSELVLELFTPNGEAGRHFFKVGSNSEPETGHSYWSSACNTASPQVTNMHIVLSLNGSSTGEGPSPSPTCLPVITQSTSQAITTSITPCMYAHPPPGGAQGQNSYWRAFNMQSFTGGAQYDVTAVSFGVQAVNNTQSVSVRLYKNSGGVFPGGTRVLLGETTLDVSPAQGGSVVQTPLVATVPTETAQLVMELYTPDGFVGAHIFYAGANNAPETGPSYWSSACGGTPVVVSSHLVFNIYGSCPPTPTPTATATGTPPTLGNYPDTSIPLSTNTTITPDAPPSNTTSIDVSTSTNFNGNLEADPATGIVRVTDPRPAGTYIVSLKAFSAGGLTATKTFTLIVTTPAACTPVSFAGPVNLAAGTYPNSVAVGDFNRDGKQDLAVANSYPGGVSILLGDGTGNFSAPTTFAAGSQPSSVAVGDFDGDGKQDLAVANFGSNNVSILLGDGAGGFSAATNFGTGNGPSSIAVGDFNGDGNQDLATASYYSTSVAILLGNGTGNFDSWTPFGAGDRPQSVAVGDFDGDGNQDLVVANYNSANVSILLGYGSGNFPVPINFAAGTHPESVAVGHFNGDGNQDLAVANHTSNDVSILLGDGTGNFSPATNFAVDFDPRSVAVGDFNGDGNQDLAVASFTSNSVSILLGDGFGSFSPTTSFGVGPDSGPYSVAVGDFNGDGKQDLAVANNVRDNVSILLRGCGPIPTPTPTCNYVYTTSTGTIVPGTVDIGNHTDDGYTVIALPFSYKLYDQSFDNVKVGSDGYLAFGTVYGFSSFSCIPEIDATYAIGAFWADQQTYNQLLGIFTSTSGVAPNRIFNIEWRTDYRWGGCGGCGVRLQYEVRLYEGQQAYDVIYGIVDSRPFSNDGVLSVGIQENNNAGRFTLVGCDSTGGEAPPVSTGQLYHYTFACGTSSTPTPTATPTTPTPTPSVTPTPSPTPSTTPCLVLYDQINPAGGGGVVSQNFESVNNIYDAQAADDFVVPAMQNWAVQQIKVNGNYFNGPGPAASVNATFYFDSGGFPGAVVSGGTFNNLSMSDTAGNFTIPLPTSLVLTAGTYWVSVQANIDFNPFGEWAWSDRTVASNSPAVWQNPGGGFATSCATYGRRGANCGIDPGAPDQVFQILGCTVTTTPITISGTVSYCSNPSPGPVPNVGLTLSGSASGLSSSDASGNYLFSVPSGGSYTVTPAKAALPPGSSGINTLDLVAVQRHFLNLGTPLSGCRLTAADVNGDSAINTVDVVAIQRFFLAQSTGTANVGKYKFTPTNRSYPGVVINQTAQNYDALVLGDVTSPFVE